MSSQSTNPDNPPTNQFIALFIIIAVLGAFIFSNSPTIHDADPDIISNPQIDPDEVAAMESQDVVMPVAMYLLENPNGWETPQTVNLVGTFQTELNCESNHSPDCTASQMTYDTLGDIWRATFELPAGFYEYRAYLDGETHIYGKNGIPGDTSEPIILNLDSAQVVNFYYDHKTGWITDNINSLIVNAVGNFQDEVGCTEEWQAECLRTWMQDVEGDGIYTYETLYIPSGSWEVKVALNESLNETYGAGGTPDGDSIQLWTPNIGHLMVMTWNSTDKSFTPFVSSGPIRLSTDLPPLAPNQ